LIFKGTAIKAPRAVGEVAAAEGARFASTVSLRVLIFNAETLLTIALRRTVIIVIASLAELDRWLETHPEVDTSGAGFHPLCV